MARLDPHQLWLLCVLIIYSGNRVGGVMCPLAPGVLLAPCHNSICIEKD